MIGSERPCNAYEAHNDEIQLIDYEGVAIAFILVGEVPTLLCGCGATHPLDRNGANEAMPMVPVGTAMRINRENTDLEEVPIAGWLCPVCKAAVEMIAAFMTAHFLTGDDTPR